MRVFILTMLFVVCCIFVFQSLGFSVFQFFSSPPSLVIPVTQTTNYQIPTTTTTTQTTTLIAVGDIMLGRSVNTKMRKLNDFAYPFTRTFDVLKSADITFGNLESPFIQNCPLTDTGMVFCADPKAIEGLTFAGFDILSISNNHILNYGIKGKEYTINLLQQNKILASTDSNVTLLRPVLNSTVTSEGQAISFLSFDLTSRVPDSLISLISQKSQTVDILVVSLHWGNEYQSQPAKWQTNLAHQIIDAGAKVIIGHHPHVTQPTETYHNGLIFYSLGNFVFDQLWSEETKKGKIAKIIFEGKKIKSWEETSIYMQNLGQPGILKN